MELIPQIKSLALAFEMLRIELHACLEKVLFNVSEELTILN